MSRMVPMTYPHSDEVADVELLPDQVPAFEAVGWQRQEIDPDSPPSPLPPVAQSSLGDAPERAEVGQPVGLVDDGDLADGQTDTTSDDQAEAADAEDSDDSKGA
jgi:hypothetical protein